MSNVQINLKEVRKIDHAVSNISSRILGEKKKLGMVRWTIPDDIMDRKDIRSRLDSVIDRLSRVEVSLDELHRVMTESIVNYVNNENRLSYDASDINNKL